MKTATSKKRRSALALLAIVASTAPRQALTTTPYAASVMPGTVVTGTSGTLITAINKNGDLQNTKSRIGGTILPNLRDTSLVTWEW
jgi:hypothetical protein